MTMAVAVREDVGLLHARIATLESEVHEATTEARAFQYYWLNVTRHNQELVEANCRLRAVLSRHALGFRSDMLVVNPPELEALLTALVVLERNVPGVPSSAHYSLREKVEQAMELRRRRPR